MNSNTVKYHKNNLRHHEVVDEIFLNAPFPMVQISDDGNILKFNHLFQQLFNLSKEKILSLNYFDNIYRMGDFGNHRLQNGLVVESYWKEANSDKMLNIREHFQYQASSMSFLVYLEDITENYKLKRTIEVNEEKFHFVIDQIPVGIYRILTTGEIVLCNQYLAQILGYNNSEELIGKMARDIFHYPDDYLKYIDSQINLKKSSFATEFIYKTPEGKELWLEDSAKIFYDTSNEMLFYDGTIKNITEKKKADNEIKRLLTAFNQLSEAIAITDVRGFIIYTNPAMEKMTGYKAVELYNRNMSFLHSGVHSRDFYKNLWNTVINGLNWEGTIVNKRKNGELYTEYMVITPVKNDEGQIVNFVAVKKDMTDVLKLEEKLRHSQKLQAIGTLAGGIAHDFNNILMGMQLYTEVLQKKIAPNTFEYEIVDKIYASQNRAKELVNQILSFSRPNIDEKAPLTVHLLVKETIKHIQNTFPPTITIVQDISDCGQILGNPTHIHQIVMNLFTNAYDAMHKQGVFTIELKRKKYIEYPDGNYRSNSFEWVCLHVKDTGEGIDNKIKSRIYDPFFTTKQVGEGTGLGLSIVHGIVQEYGGEIFFTSAKGKGTDFYVYLPAI
jgi:PAS domain S-box-containing protein